MPSMSNRIFSLFAELIAGEFSPRWKSKSFGSIKRGSILIIELVYLLLSVSSVGSILIMQWSNLYSNGVVFSSWKLISVDSEP